MDGLVMAPLKQDSDLVDVLTTVGAEGRMRITRSRRGQLQLFITVVEGRIREPLSHMVALHRVNFILIADSGKGECAEHL